MHVFTYGSLMYQPVWTRVVAGTYQWKPAILRGYARRKLPGEVYPAMARADAGSSIQGIVHLEVTPEDLVTLDRFEDEGVHYGRIEVTVQLADGSDLPAAAYIYLHPERLGTAEWDKAEFEKQGLEYFLRSYVRDRVEGP